MKMSHLLGRRFKEKPSDTKLKSHELLVRGGYIRSVSNGIFSTMLPGQKILKNIESIVRDEMNKIEGQEVEMPLVQPKELWEESGRYQSINDELVRLKDRNDHEMVLAMTHEEAAVALARTEAVSYKDYPFIIYQFAKKFRDEARPRGGLIRVKEFTMKDAYSFHTNQADLEDYYNKCAVAYGRIFARAGVPEVIAIKSDSGMMGGSVSHEYMLLTDAGEDTIVTCQDCDYKANKEVATAKIEHHIQNEQELALEKIYTPNAKSIDDLADTLNLPSSRFIKTVFYESASSESKPVAVMIRGDLEVNEAKLAKIIKSNLTIATDETIKKIGSVAGFASPYGIEDKCNVIVDKSLQGEKNLIAGANELNYHLKNINLGRDIRNVKYFDIASVRDGDICSKCGGSLKLNRGIEVGNIFQLGTKYTEKMNMSYIDENGKSQTPIMGCYGIGIGRLMASVAEVRNDEKGPIWPITIAPWKLSLISLSPKNDTETVDTCSQKLYETLRKKSIDVLWDDRKASAGEKFADADLLGIPLHYVVSSRNLEKGLIEWKERATGNKGFVPVEQAISFAEAWISEETHKINSLADKVKPLSLDEISNKSVQKNNINMTITKLGKDR